MMMRTAVFLLTGFALLLFRPTASAQTAAATDSLLQLELEAGQERVRENEPVRLGLRAHGGRGRYTYFIESAPVEIEREAALEGGQFAWTPGYDFVGRADRSRTVPVTLGVVDGGGNRATNQFALTVVHVNRAPEVVGRPVAYARPNAEMSYEIPVRDEDQDPLEFTLLSSPSPGASLSSSGVFSWTPTSTEYSRLPDTFRFRVQDRNASREGRLEVQKYPGGLPPSLRLIAEQDSVREGDRISLEVKVDDPDGLDDIAVVSLVNPPAENADFEYDVGTGIGKFSWVPDYGFIPEGGGPREVPLRLRAVDEGGKESTIAKTVRVTPRVRPERLCQDYSSTLKESVALLMQLERRQANLSAKAGRADGFRIGRAVVEALTGGATVLISQLVKDGSSKTRWTGITGGMTALLGALEVANVFPTASTYNARLDEVTAAKNELDARIKEFSRTFSWQERRYDSKFQAEREALTSKVNAIRSSVDLESIPEPTPSNGDMQQKTGYSYRSCQ